MKIVIPDRINLGEKYIQQIKNLGDVEIFEDVPSDDEEVIRRIEGAELITANWIDITEKVIEATPTLKYIVVPAVGYDWVDVKVATAHGIKVLNSPTFNSQAVAEATIGLMIVLMRKILFANSELKSGIWAPKKYVGLELKGKKLGVIGYGNIGKKVADLAQKFGMEVTFVNSKSSEQELESLVSESDVVSLHLPLTDKTRHLLNRDRLKLMKKGSFLINMARGAILDQEMLADLLETNYLGGAALDVFENEPLTGEPNEKMTKLSNMENVVATPHVAANSLEASERLGAEIVANLKSCIDGNPINVIN